MKLHKTLLYLTGALLALSACQNQHADQAPPKTSIFNYDSLSYEMAKNYVKNYEKHAGNIDSTYTVNGVARVKKTTNTRCIWFSAERLQQMLDKIKGEGGDGIRFYLATYDSIYPQAIGGLTPPPEYWGRNTLVMVSTKDSTNKKDQIFHRDYYTSPKPKANKPATGFILGGTPENRGEICPPPKNCNSIGATLIP